VRLGQCGPQDREQAGHVGRENAAGLGVAAHRPLRDGGFNLDYLRLTA
jgi:hypothetical protein